MSSSLPAEPAELTKGCCAAAYSGDVVAMVLGESYHPGGLALTCGLLEHLHLVADARVLDVASGRGATALIIAGGHLVEVDDVDLSESNVCPAERLDDPADIGPGEHQALDVAEDARSGVALRRELVDRHHPGPGSGIPPAVEVEVAQDGEQPRLEIAPRREAVPSAERPQTGLLDEILRLVRIAGKRAGDGEQPQLEAGKAMPATVNPHNRRYLLVKCDRLGHEGIQAGGHAKARSIGEHHDRLQGVGGTVRAT